MTTLQDRLTGVFTALVTPFRDGAVDMPAFEALVERQIEAGVAGLVPVGTTGEAATLDAEEAELVIRRTVEIAAGRVMVIAGTGSNNTRRTVEATRRAERLGVDGALVVTPYYNKPSQDGLVDHYATVAAATSLPIMLYSVPGRCGVEIAPETAARIAGRCPNVVAIKEAGGRAERVSLLRRACGPDIAIHSGDDGLTLPFLALGACGVTSVVSNLAPREMVEMVAAWRAGRFSQALALHEALLGLMEALFVEGNPAPVKAALAMNGLMTPDLRPPLAPLTPASRAVLDDALRAFRGRNSRTEGLAGAAGLQEVGHVAPSP